MFEKWRYFRKARNVSLSPAEKTAGREVLARFMETHPVRDGEVARHIERRDTFTPSPFALVNAKPMPLILALLVALSGGTALAAESALPNSALYPVKIHVNENARRAFALSAEAKTDVEVSLTGRRLEEGEALVGRTTFDANAWAALEAGFTRNMEASRVRIRALEASGDHEAAAAASTKLAAELAAHAAILASLEAGTDVLEGGHASSSQDISADLEANVSVEGGERRATPQQLKAEEAVQVRALLHLLETAQSDIRGETTIDESVDDEAATSPSEPTNAEADIRTEAEVKVNVPVRVEVQQGAGLELDL